LQPEWLRGQSSKVTAAPLAEKVTPRAIRVDGVPSGSISDTAPRLRPTAHQDALLMAVHEESVVQDALAVYRRVAMHPHVEV
jgi:hypothetical protein